MAEQRADFTLTFRRLSALSGADSAGDAAVRELFDDPAAFDAWADRWRRRLALEERGEEARRQDMRACNPAYIPRNHRVEEAIVAATSRGDLAPMERLLQVVSRPYDDHPQLADFARPPEPHEVVRATFCGT